MMRLGDEELLRLTREQPDAAGVFVARFERPTLAFFRRRVADSQTALDLTSETFAQAMLECGMGARVDDAASWLFAIAKGRLADFERRGAVGGARRPRHPADDGLGEMEDDLALLAVSSVLRDSPADCRRPALPPPP
jgi:DNA-directed RNA polymerase specialized sigma24 family protein